MGVFKGERTHLAKKLDEVSAVDTLAFHFTRPLWELGESVSPKQSALHWVGINHLPTGCLWKMRHEQTALAVEEPPERGMEVDTDEHMLGSFRPCTGLQGDL